MTEPDEQVEQDEAVSAAEADDAEDEAAEAEESTDAADDAEDEAAAPPEASGPSPEEWEDRFKKIAARFKTYTRAVGTILEEDATDLLPCPLCSDAVPGFVNVHDAGKVAEETLGAVQEFIGYQAPQTLHRSRVNETCGTCGGLGELATGSLVNNYKTRVCDDCHGFGYRGPGNVHDVPNLVLVPPDDPNGAVGGIDLSAALASIQERQGQ